MTDLTTPASAVNKPGQVTAITPAPVAQAAVTASDLEHTFLAFAKENAGELIAVVISTLAAVGFLYWAF